MFETESISNFGHLNFEFFICVNKIWHLYSSWYQEIKIDLFMHFPHLYRLYF